MGARARTTGPLARGGVVVPHMTMRADGTVLQHVAASEVVVSAHEPSTAGAPLHDDLAHEAITARLVACTLGAERRPELRTDPAGKVAALMAQGIVHLRESGRRLAADLARYQYRPPRDTGTLR